MFAGRFDLFVHSFIGEVKHSEHNELSLDYHCDEVATAKRASKAKAAGFAEALVGGRRYGYPELCRQSREG